MRRDSFVQTISAYLAITLDLPSTIDILSSPVNEAYHSGTGTPHSQPSTSIYRKHTNKETIDDSQKTALENLWTALLTAAKDHPLNTTEQSNLIALLGGLKKLPDPQRGGKSESESEPRPRTQFEESAKKPWSTLHLLNETIMSLWDGVLSIDTLPTPQWTNFNGFLARARKEKIIVDPFERLAISLCRTALQKDEEDEKMLNALVSGAGVWMLVLGEEVWAFMYETGEEVEEIKSHWGLWKTRFLFMSHREELSIQARELAAEAGAIMQRVA